MVLRRRLRIPISTSAFRPADATSTTTRASEREKESMCTCSRARERERERGRQREGLSGCVREDNQQTNMTLTSALAQMPIVADYDPKQKQYVWDYVAVRYFSKRGGDSIQQYVLGGRESVGGVMHTCIHTLLSHDAHMHTHPPHKR